MVVGVVKDSEARAMLNPDGRLRLRVLEKEAQVSYGSDLNHKMRTKLERKRRTNLKSGISVDDF